MPENQPELLDPKAAAKPPGIVNSICRFDDHDGQRFVQIHGQCFYTYDLDDALTERFVWVQLHLAGYAKMVEIATVTGIALRSLQRWKKSAEQGGFEALLPKPIPGRPRTLTTTFKRQVLRLINQGKNHDEIEKRFGLSGSSIDRLVAAEKGKHQEQLELEEDVEDVEDVFIPELPELQWQREQGASSAPKRCRIRASGRGSASQRTGDSLRATSQRSAQPGIGQSSGEVGHD